MSKNVKLTAEEAQLLVDLLNAGPIARLGGGHWSVGAWGDICAECRELSAAVTLREKLQKV